ncbi:MAG: lipopolysaccharide biosynthesis protein [Terracidiphilus sp.]
MRATEQTSLTRSTGAALRWSYAGSSVRLALTFGVNILLTRLLGPKPFGQIAIALLFFGLGNLLANVGVGTALIQKEQVDARDVRFCFTVQMVFGVAVALALCWSAPAWAAFFHQGEMTGILRWLAPLFVFQSFGGPALALLNRGQKTREIQLASILSYVIAFLGFAVPMALRGCGAWSLVAAYLVQSLVNSVLVYAQRRHSLVPLVRRSDLRLLRFGASTLGANVCNWGIGNLDNTFVGRVAGPVALGFYSRAFTLASLPAENIIANLQQVLLPAFSRVQNQTERIRRAYLGTFGLVALVLLPPFCAMAAVPGIVVVGLYGSPWARAAVLFQPLALAIPLNALMALSGPVLSARGKPHAEMKLQFGVVLLAGALFWMSVRQSVLWLSWAVLLVYLVRFFVLTHAALQETGARWRDLARAALPAIFLAKVATGIAVILHLALESMLMGTQLAVVAGGTALGILSVLVAGRRMVFRPIVEQMPQLESFLDMSFRRANARELVEGAL